MTLVLRQAWLVARKDLTIEARSRVTLNQVAPLGLLVLIVFAFAFDADQNLLGRGGPGLFWIGVLFAGVIVIQRAFSVEDVDGITDALRLSGLRPAAIHLGKTLAVTLELLVLELGLFLGVIVFFDSRVDDWPLLIVGALVVTVGFAAAGSLYGTLSLGLRLRETLLPLLFVPVAAPLLLAGSRAFERAFGVNDQAGWSWVGLAALMSGVHLALGTLAVAPLLEDG